MNPTSSKIMDGKETKNKNKIVGRFELVLNLLPRFRNLKKKWKKKTKVQIGPPNPLYLEPPPNLANFPTC
jgi:hypothetical protein